MVSEEFVRCPLTFPYVYYFHYILQPQYCVRVIYVNFQVTSVTTHALSSLDTIFVVVPIKLI